MTKYETPVSSSLSVPAGVNSAGGSFGLSFGLAMAGGVMLAVMAFSFTNLTESSTVIPADQQAQLASVMEDDAEIVSDAQLADVLEAEPPDVQAEVLDINRVARDRALQAALLIPLLAQTIVSFRGNSLIPGFGGNRPVMVEQETVDHTVVTRK